MSTEFFNLEIGGGFIIMLALLYYLLGFELLAALIIAALVHESGHLLALRLSGIRLSRIRLGAAGAQIEAGGVNRPYLQSAFTALSGPLAGIFLYLLLLPVDKSYASVSLMLSLLNLLPVGGLDGGSALKNILTFFFGLTIADRVLCVTGCCCILAVFILSFITFNFMLALTAVWLLIDFARDVL